MRNQMKVSERKAGGGKRQIFTLIVMIEVGTINLNFLNYR